MKAITILALLLAVVAVQARRNLTLAQACDREACRLPTCRCTGTDIPGGLHPRDTPQFVLLTFDDAVNTVNIETYRKLYWRRNRNGCKIGINFFINHEYNNYRLVNELYNEGYEIALHSITHSTPTSYWAQASYETMMLEFGDQRKQMAHFANIPINDIQGVRLPFLQMAGNASFEMMQTVGLTYDISWPTTRANPAIWPYTLDYASWQECLIPPCPTASLPGPWVIPIVTWTDQQNFPCSYVDACIFRPDLEDENGWFRFIMSNFENHYGGNRAPFGFYVHEQFLASNPAVFRAFNRFLDVVTNLHDTFLVNAQDVIDWVRRPVRLDEYARQPCRFRRPAQCLPRFCGPLSSVQTERQYWMQMCGPASCPQVYPWLRNPFGLRQNVLQH